MNCKLDVQTEKEEKPCTKNQGWEPIHQKYKVNENTSRHNPTKKNKSKQSTKIKWTPYAKRTHGLELTINDNKENLRKSYHLPQIG